MEMKSDQIVRIVAIVGMSVSLAIFYGLNGTGPVATGFGVVSPFVVTVAFQLFCAVPEIIDMLPFGPTRKA